jgi:hypothetical protein
VARPKTPKICFRNTTYGSQLSSYNTPWRHGYHHDEYVAISRAWQPRMNFSSYAAAIEFGTDDRCVRIMYSTLARSATASQVAAQEIIIRLAVTAHCTGTRDTSSTFGNADTARCSPELAAETIQMILARNHDASNDPAKLLPNNISAPQVEDRVVPISLVPYHIDPSLHRQVIAMPRGSATPRKQITLAVKFV